MTNVSSSLRFQCFRASCSTFPAFQQNKGPVLVETAIPKRRSVSLFGLGDGSVMREQGGGRPDGETAVGILQRRAERLARYLNNVEERSGRHTIMIYCLSRPPSPSFLPDLIYHANHICYSCSSRHPAIFMFHCITFSSRFPSPFWLKVVRSIAFPPHLVPRD